MSGADKGEQCGVDVVEEAGQVAQPGPQTELRLSRTFCCPAGSSSPSTSGTAGLRRRSPCPGRGPWPARPAHSGGPSRGGAGQSPCGRPRSARSALCRRSRRAPHAGRRRRCPRRSRRPCAAGRPGRSGRRAPAPLLRRARSSSAESSTPEVLRRLDDADACVRLQVRKQLLEQVGARREIGVEDEDVRSPDERRSRSWRLPAFLNQPRFGRRAVAEAEVRGHRCDLGIGAVVEHVGGRPLRGRYCAMWRRASRCCAAPRWARRTPAGRHRRVGYTAGRQDKRQPPVAHEVEVAGEGIHRSDTR